MFTLGIVCILAAIVGGGLSAFGIKTPVINSLSRQLLLAAFGALLVVSARWSDIRPIVFPPQLVSIKDGPTALGSGALHKTPLSSERSGSIEVAMQALTPNTTQPRVTICPAEVQGECPWRQLSAADSYAVTLAAGSATVTVFNYLQNPPITYTLQIKYSVDTWRPAGWVYAAATALVLGGFLIVTLARRAKAREGAVDALERDVLRFMWNVHNGTIQFAELQDILGVHPNLLSIACHRLHKRGFVGYNPYVSDSPVQLLPEGREYAAENGLMDARDILQRAADRVPTNPDYVIRIVNPGEFGVTPQSDRAKNNMLDGRASVGTVVFRGRDPALFEFVRVREAAGFTFAGKDLLAG